jgi:hypothetical protein
MSKKNTLVTSLLIGIGVSAFFLLRKASKMKRMSDLLSISAGLRGKPALKGGIFGKILVPVKIELTNRTDEELRLKIPSVKLFYANNELGDILPNDNEVVVKRYAKTLIDSITFEIPVSNLINIGIGKDLLLKSPSELTKNMQLKITLYVNGVPVTFNQALAGFGLGLTATSLRKIKPKKDYEHLIEPIGSLDRTDPILNQNGTVDDTVNYMIDIVRQYKDDTKTLAKRLKRKTLKETLENIWNFVYTYIKYEPDSTLFEQIRRPLRTLHDQKGDCDCYSVLIGSILENLNIPFKFRITAYYNRPYFQHVYVIVPTGDGNYITVDPVVDAFNYEKPFTNHKDFEFKK